MRVLVIEDEYYIADDIRRSLSAAGATVVALVGTLDSAREAVGRGDYDCAILDLNLHGDSAVELVERLVALERPFVIGTGYSGSVVPEHLHQYPRLRKPFETDKLIEALKARA